MPMASCCPYQPRGMLSSHTAPGEVTSRSTALLTSRTFYAGAAHPRLQKQGGGLGESGPWGAKLLSKVWPWGWGACVAPRGLEPALTLPEYHCLQGGLCTGCTLSSSSALGLRGTCPSHVLILDLQPPLTIPPKERHCGSHQHPCTGNKRTAMVQPRSLEPGRSRVTFPPHGSTARPSL